MGTIIDTLSQLNVAEDDFVYLNYEDSAEVWHIADNYIEDALTETSTASMLAELLATSGVTVLSRYGEDVLELMREEGLLDDYDRQDWFEEYLTQQIQKEAYEYDLLTISTERRDHKRGTCEIASNIKIRVAELVALGSDADSLVAAWDVAVQTQHGTLALA